MPKQEVISSESEERSLSPERVYAPKKEEDARLNRPLHYDTIKQEQQQPHVKKQLKDEPQSRSHLTPAKIEEQNRLITGRSVTRVKARVETVTFPPPAREIPLITRKVGAKELVNPKLEFEVCARKLIEGMKRAHKLDRKALEEGTLAYHKVKMIEHLKDKLINVYVRRSFVQQGALQVIQKWLERTVGPDDQQHEPTLHVRINIVRVLQTLHLSCHDLANTKQLQQLLQRNRLSQVQQLRELCREVLASWDYTMVEAVRKK